MQKLKFLQKFSLLLIALCLSNIAFGQLTGIKTIPGDYATITAAITDLNTQGVGAGGITFNVAAGYTETITAPLSITATGTLANPIIFQKSGSGANPLITAFVGISTPGSAVQDGIWNLVGSDYITIDGIDLYDPNSTNPATMEYGYGMFKASVTNGCQYNTIKNCVVTLSRENWASGGTLSVDGSRAINVINALVTTQTTVVTPTAASGTNSYNKFYSNTLQNCNYGIALIGYAGATPFTLCDFGNDIGGTALATGNNIINFGGGAASTNPSAGVRTLAQYNLNVSYNTINNNNGSGVSHVSTLRGIYLNTAVSASETINNNTISISSGATTSQVSVIENVAGATAAGNTVSISNNTINNCNWAAATTGTFYGIYSTASAANVNINNNSFASLTRPGTGATNLIYNSGVVATALSISNNTYNNLSIASTGSVYFIYTNNATNNITVNNNAISGTFAKSGAGGTVFGYYDFGSPTGGTATLNGNNFSNITLNGATTFYGIYHATSVTQTEVITNNTVSNITGGSSTIYGIYQGYGAAGSTVNGNTVNAITSAGAIYGLYIGASTAPVSLTAYNNTVYNLNTTGASTIYGIYNSLGTATSIYKNNVYNLTANNAAGIVYGIDIAGGALTYVYNNFVSDLKAPIATGTNAVNGIYIPGGTSVGVYYNTIFLNATSSSTTTFGTSGIYKSATVLGDYRNNIIVNTSTPGPTGGFTVANRWSGVYNATYFAPTSNSNCYYAGTPAANKLIFYDGTNSERTIDSYKSRVSPSEAFSFTEIPPFVNNTTPPYNLHLQTTVPTQCESAGIRITAPIAITTDYDGDIRWGEGGYAGAGISVDVGADEGNFILLHLTPPTIVYTPLSNTFLTSPRSLAATITDPFGVGSGANQPVLYWKINAAASYTGPVAPTSIVGNVYTYDFGAGVVTGDIVSYFIVAQDNSPNNNVGSYPAGATCTNNPPLASSGPPNPSFYVISGYLSGVKTVGTGGDYATLTAAVFALNNNELNGALTLSLINTDYSTNETFPLVINSNAGSSTTNTVTIKPANGVIATITGSVNSGPLLRVLGSSNLIIDGSNAVGGTTRDLTISNTSITSPQVLVIGSVGLTPITNVTTKNCNLINGALTSTAVLISDGNSAGTAGYFNNITIQNNTIQKAYMGLYSIAVVAAGNGSGLNISNNNLAATGANAIRYVGLYIQGVDGATISNNTIGNFDNIAVEVDRGIWFATGTINSTINGNTISTLGGAGSAVGIAISSGLANSSLNISNNTISGLTTTGTVPNYGIYFYGATSGANITKNNIYNIKNTNAGGYSATGITLASTLTTANTNVSNNFISDIAGYGYGSTTADNGYGINISSGGGYNLYFNTVSLATNQTLVTGSPACLFISSSVVTANCLDIRDNIFSIDATIGTNRYAVLCNAANTVFSNIDYNDYYTSGPNLGYLGVNQANITAWRIATGKDVNSFTAVPAFISPTNIHLALNGNCGIDGKGTPIAGITTDYDGDTRSLTTPDPGADEFTATTLNAPISANQVGCFGGTIPNLSATVIGTAKWYTDAGLTNLVFTGNPFATGQTAIGVYTYYVKDSLGTCNSSATTVTLTIDDTPAQPSAISGATTPCQGTSQNYSVTDVPGTTYTWTFPTGWVQTAGGTTNSITVTVGSGSGDITVTPSNTNCSGNARTLAVTPTTVPAQPSTITGATTPCQGTSQNYSVTDVPGTTYTWTFPTGWVQTAGGTTNSITVTVGNGTGNITVTPSNGCGNGTSQTLSVTPTDVPAQPSAISGEINPPENSSQVYSVTNVTGVTYNWTFPTGWVQTGGGTTNSVTVTVGSASGDITCTPSNACGNGTPRTLAVTPSGVGIIETTNYNNISIIPNPSNGIVDITFNGLSNEVVLQLQNTQSKIIFTSKFIADKNIFTKTFDFSKYPKGLYFVRIYSGEKTSISKLILQ